jgi:hypothetical protein
MDTPFDLSGSSQRIEVSQSCETAEREGHKKRGHEGRSPVIKYARITPAWNTVSTGEGEKPGNSSVILIQVG